MVHVRPMWTKEVSRNKGREELEPLSLNLIRLQIGTPAIPPFRLVILAFREYEEIRE